MSSTTWWHNQIHTQSLQSVLNEDVRDHFQDSWILFHRGKVGRRNSFCKSVVQNPFRYHWFRMNRYVHMHRPYLFDGLFLKTPANGNTSNRIQGTMPSFERILGIYCCQHLLFVDCYCCYHCSTFSMESLKYHVSVFAYPDFLRIIAASRIGWDSMRLIKNTCLSILLNQK